MCCGSGSCTRMPVHRADPRFSASISASSSACVVGAGKIVARTSACRRRRSSCACCARRPATPAFSPTSTTASPVAPCPARNARWQPVRNVGREARCARLAVEDAGSHVDRVRAAGFRDREGPRILTDCATTLRRRCSRARFGPRTADYNASMIADPESDGGVARACARARAAAGNYRPLRVEGSDAGWLDDARRSAPRADERGLRRARRRRALRRWRSTDENEPQRRDRSRRARARGRRRSSPRWRDETLRGGTGTPAPRRGFSSSALPRAYFGIHTYAAHVNGVGPRRATVSGCGSRGAARRSRSIRECSTIWSAAESPVGCRRSRRRSSRKHGRKPASLHRWRRLASPRRHRANLPRAARRAAARRRFSFTTCGCPHGFAPAGQDGEVVDHRLVHAARSGAADRRRTRAPTRSPRTRVS